MFGRFHQSFFNNLPGFGNFKAKKINKEIFSYYSFFIDDCDYLITALVQNPFEKSVKLSKIRETFGDKIYQNLLILNRMHDRDREILHSYEEYSSLALLFLINFKFLFNSRSKKINEKINLKKAKFVLDLLLLNDISEIRDELEDQLFNYIYPELFKKYEVHQDKSRKTYRIVEKEVINKLNQHLVDKGIKAQIQSRLKSIYSIHNKISKKNILLSQVLDLIGLRIITAAKEQCYEVMEVILANWPVLNDKVKDFIAVPKDNGYQSIHLTMIIDNYPVEIQIRTKDMHYHAQFGKSAHFRYKYS